MDKVIEAYIATIDFLVKKNYEKEQTIKKLQERLKNEKKT